METDATDFTNFSGDLLIRDLEGQLISKTTLEDGQAIENNTNGRSMSGCSEVRYEWLGGQMVRMVVVYANCDSPLAGEGGYGGSSDPAGGPNADNDGIPGAGAPITGYDFSSFEKMMNDLNEFLESDSWDASDPYDDWNQLTECEKDFFRSNPSFLYYAKIDKIYAENYPKELFDDCTLHNGIGDAFRHAFFSTMNAKRMGYANAKKLGDAHECNVPNSEYDQKEMDLNNNQWGFDFYMRTGTTNATIFFNEFMIAMGNNEISILKEDC